MLSFEDEREGGFASSPIAMRRSFQWNRRRRSSSTRNATFGSAKRSPTITSFRSRNRRFRAVVAHRLVAGHSIDVLSLFCTFCFFVSYAEENQQQQQQQQQSLFLDDFTCRSLTCLPVAWGRSSSCCSCLSFVLSLSHPVTIFLL